MIAARLTLLSALAVVVVTLFPREPHVDLRLSAGRGALELVNSRDGAAAFEASNMKPGDAVAGTVTVENRGSSSARLFLRSSAPRGTLGQVLRTRITESGTTLAEGALAVVAGCHDLGRLSAGATRTFRFSATWQAGEADNAYAGSSATVDEHWVANQRGDACVPGQQEPAPRLVISHRQVALVHGRAQLRVRCRGAAGEICAGAIHLRARNRLRSRLAAAGATSARFRVPAGRRGTVYVRVPPPSRAPLRTRGKAIALAVIQPQRVSRLITLVREKKMLHPG